MLFLKLYRHFFLSVIRTDGSDGIIAAKILKTILFFFVIFGYSIISFFLLPTLFKPYLSHYSVVECMGIIILPLMIYSFFLKLAMIDNSTHALSCYKHLPMNRMSLIRFFVLKNLLKPNQYGLIFLSYPLLLKMGFLHQEQWQIIISMMITYLLVVITLIFLVSYLHIRFKIDTSVSGFLFVIFLAGLYSLTLVPTPIMNKVLDVIAWIFVKPVGAIFFLLIIILLCLALRAYFNQLWYDEKRQENDISLKSTDRMDSLLAGRGEVMSLVGLIVKQYLRSKMYRTLIMMTIVPVVFSLIMEKVLVTTSSGNTLNAYFFYAMMYFSLMKTTYSSQMDFFDGLMTMRIRLKDYVLASYIILQSATLILFLGSLVLVLFGTTTLFEVITFFLFLMGPMAYYTLYSATKNNTKMEKRSQMKKRDSFSFMNIVVLTILILSQKLMFFSPTIMYIMIALSIVLIALYKPILNYLTNRLRRKKYEMIERFNQLK